jgi:hypothetical protein
VTILNILTHPPALISRTGCSREKCQRARFVILLAIVILAVLVVSLSPSRAMEFAERFNGAVRIDGNSMWISAEGEITSETPAAFEKFLANATIWKRQRIVFNSLEALSWRV